MASVLLLTSLAVDEDFRWDYGFEVSWEAVLIEVWYERPTLLV